MKDCLFELLMNFFEKTLTEIKDANPTTTSANTTLNPDLSDSESSNKVSATNTLSIFTNNDNHVLRQRRKESIRIFTPDEQYKFTKASYQFMVRLMRLGLIAPDTMEEIIHQLLFSDSSFVTLQETKWAIRNTLSNKLDPKQLAFLDLVLYQKEDRLPLH